MDGNFQQCAWNCQEGSQSGQPANGPQFVSCAAWLWHQEEERKRWSNACGNISLSCNNLCNNPQRLAYEAGLCTLVFKGFQDRTKWEKGAELSKDAPSSQQGPRVILRQTGYLWQILVSLSNSGGEKAVHAVKTWCESSSKKFRTALPFGKQMASVF